MQEILQRIPRTIISCFNHYGAVWCVQNKQWKLILHAPTLFFRIGSGPSTNHQFVAISTTFRHTSIKNYLSLNDRQSWTRIVRMIGVENRAVVYICSL
jgi:hypothetical protein